MSSALLTNSAKLAQRMIAKFGAIVTLSRTVPGTYNPLTDTRSPDVVQSVAINAVEQAYTPLLGVGLGQSYEPAALVVTDGRSFLIAGLDAPFPPGPGMSITSATGAKFAISNVKIDAPDGRPILYTCGAKAA